MATSLLITYETGVGAQNHTAPEYGWGHFDEVAVYDYALRAVDAVALHEATGL